MIIFKRTYLRRRFGEVTWVNGYPSRVYVDANVVMDIQTTDDTIRTTEDGSQAVQNLKVFCDEAFVLDHEVGHSRADQVWFQGKWFECKSCRLSNNTFLAHYVATFTECADQAEPPEVNT